MARTKEMTLRLPPFTPAVTWLLAANTAIFLFMELLAHALPETVRYIYTHFGLCAEDVVVHGWIWQVVTYSFLHVDFTHWFGNMLGIWMFGSSFEQSWGTRRFLELFSVGVLGASIVTIALSYGRVLSNPHVLTVGASGGVFAILIAFGMVFADNEITLIPFPFLLKAKYFAAILIVVTLALAIGGGGNVSYIAHLGGLFSGYIYVKFISSSGITRQLSESYFAGRNAWHLWKRRQSAKKFEVYMRKSERDVQFDDKGNYIPPEDGPPPRKPNGDSGSKWVN